MTPEAALQLLRTVLTHDSFSANYKTFEAVQRALQCLEAVVKKHVEAGEKQP